MSPSSAGSADGGTTSEWGWHPSRQVEVQKGEISTKVVPGRMKIAFAVFEPTPVINTAAEAKSCT